MDLAQNETVNINITTNATTDPEPCSTFYPFNCAPEQIDAEHQFLALVIVALASAVCVLYLLVLVLAVLVHKASVVLRASIALGNSATAKSDAHEARKGLLSHVKSSFASRDKSGAKKGKRTTFAEDTSCASPRDVDEEDL